MYVLHIQIAAAPKLEKGRKEPGDVPSKAHVPSGRPSTYEDIPVSNIRGVIAKRLGESKVIISCFIDSRNKISYLYFISNIIIQS